MAKVSEVLELASHKSSDITDSNILYPSVKAVKQHISNNKDQAYAENEEESWTTSSLLVNKLTLNLIPKFSDKYLLNFYFELTNSTNTETSTWQLRQDENIILGTGIIIPPKSSNDYVAVQGFKIVELIKDISYFFYIDFGRVTKTAKIRRSRIYLTKQ